MRESFIFYSSFVEAIDELPEDIQLKVYQAISHYAIYGEECNLSGIAKAVFALIKPQIDANNKRYIDGCKGGRPKKEIKNENKKPVVFKNEKNKKPNDNDNVNDNVNVNVNENDIPPIIPQRDISVCEENLIKNPHLKTDPFTNPLIDKCFDVYKQNCFNLPKLRFEPRNRQVREELTDFLAEIDNDVGYFEELCQKANDLKQICNKPIDFKSLIRNHIGIVNGKYLEKDDIFDYEEYLKTHGTNN